MADGVSYCLGFLRPGEKTEVIDVAQSTGAREEVLRALRAGHDAQTIWGALGRCLGVPETAVLLACLFEHTGQSGVILDSPTSRVATVREAGLRSLSQHDATSCASQGWQLSQQCAVQFADALRELSQKTSRIGEAIRNLGLVSNHPLANGIPGRVGRLRAYGNAIVPQVGAEFIKSVMDLED